MPIPKEWSCWKRLRAWLTWADFDQGVHDKALSRWQCVFRWLGF